MTNPVESIRIYNAAGDYIIDVDMPDDPDLTVDKAFDYAFAAAKRNGLTPGEFGVEVNQAPSS